MSSLSNADQSASKADDAGHDDVSSNAQPPSIQDDYHAALESWLALCHDQDYVVTRPATSSASHKLSEGSETIVLGRYHDGGTLEDASSATLRDELLRRDSGVNKLPQKIPQTIVSALLQGVNAISPSRSVSGGAGRELHEADENSDPEDVFPRYSAAQKGKWKDRADDDVVHDGPHDRAESPQFDFPPFPNSVGEWVVHNRPVLQDYADRQVTLPLGQRLEVSIDEPSQFILGALQLLVNRDQPGCTDRSRRLGPQLIDNFVDISRWIKEYFRSRHGTHVVDTDVSTLLVIILNNFYEGQVQLIDRLVEFALGNMRIGGRCSLDMADFAFGFDFRMSQDLPFYVETGSQLRKPRPIRAVEVHCSPLEPVTTSSGRQVKPTKRAQEGAVQAQKNAGGRRNNINSGRSKGKNAGQVAKDKSAARDPVPAAPPKKAPERPSSDRMVPKAPRVATAAVVAAAPSQASTAGVTYRPILPSNLRPSPVLPGSPSAPDTTSAQSGEGIQPKLSTSASGDALEVSGTAGSNLKHGSLLPRLKIKLPVSGETAGTITAGTARAPATGEPRTAANASVSEAPNRKQSSNRGRPPERPCKGGHGYNTHRGRGRGGHGHDGDRGRADNADGVLSTAASSGDRAEEAPAPAPVPAAVRVPVAPPITAPTVEHTFVPRSAGTSSRARPHGVGNDIERYLSTFSLKKPDPGHQQGKKRKLDDGDD